MRHDETAAGAAEHWDSLAEAERTKAAEARAAGLFPGVHDCKAELYARTAEALRMEAKTGKPHCVGHLSPNCGTR